MCSTVWSISLTYDNFFGSLVNIDSRIKACCAAGLIFIVGFLVECQRCFLFIFTSNQSAKASDEHRNMICILNNELNYCLILVHETTSNHQQTHTHICTDIDTNSNTHAQTHKALKCVYEKAGERVRLRARVSYLVSWSYVYAFNNWRKSVYGA